MATHTKTDPACREHRAPRTALGRWLFKRNRGHMCWACFNRRAGQRPQRDQFAALMDAVYR